MLKLDIREAIELIRSGQWLRISCITADLVKETGGQVIDYPKCRIARRQLLEQSGAATTGKTDISRPANHNANFTINIEMENGEIRKIHPALITHINQQPVL